MVPQFLHYRYRVVVDACGQDSKQTEKSRAVSLINSRMAGMKTVVLPLLLLVLFGSGAYVYLEMKGVNEVEVEEVGSAGGNMRGAGKDQIKKSVENMKQGYATSIKEKNVFATKELGNGYPESFPLLDVRSVLLHAPLSFPLCMIHAYGRAFACH
jgi:hypothetical protein